MYKQLDNLLSAESSEDSWYDDGCILASEILSEFSSMDWEELSNSVLTKPLVWQKKLAYCMDRNCNMYELKILLSLIDTEDDDLFLICVDTLRNFTRSESKQMLLANSFMLHRINDVMSRASLPVKKVLEDFVRKINL